VLFPAQHPESMSTSWFVVIGAMAVALALPFLIYGIHALIRGVTQTRVDVERNATDVRRSIDQQSGNVRDLVSSQEKLIERIQHLEAIVTSEAWDAMAREKRERIAEGVLRLDEDHASDEDRAARLARSLSRD
ncbi:MAG: hypothetical protein O3C45_01885, partial [Bacteroidetes bacterium]|nr:hypothetical protein [Bacteroidota bacterium]